MTRFLLALVILLPLAATQARAAVTLGEEVRRFVTDADPVIALRNVRVLDGTGAPPRDAATILVENGVIAAVRSAGNLAIPEGARILDLAGSTVIPGIVDAHAHVHYGMFGRPTVNLSFSAPRLYLAAGVTTARVTGSFAPYEDLALQRAIDAGRTPGPRLFLSGPYLAGPGPPLAAMPVIETPEQARRIVDYWADEGATWFKLYTTVREDVARAVIEAAHARGARVTGHLCSIGFTRAAELGIDNVEHGLFADSEYDPRKQPGICPPPDFAALARFDPDGEAARRTFRILVEHGVAMTSTLAVLETLVAGRPQEIDPRLLAAMHPDVRATYLATYERMKQGGGILTEAALRNVMAYERAFVAAGGLLAAGSDPSGSGGAVAGLGAQRNFELLVEAGFPPLEALAIVTRNGARLLGIEDEAGTIEAGKRADLVVLGGDPLDDPRRIRDVTRVFRDGIGYDPAALLESVRDTVGTR